MIQERRPIQIHCDGGYASNEGAAAFVVHVHRPLDGDVVRIGYRVVFLQNCSSSFQAELTALEMAISTRRLSAEERKERLAEFVAESERQGFELLSDRQVTKLKQSQLRRQGLSSLGDPALVEQLKLSEDQQQQVRQILQERDQELRGADRQRAVLLRAQFERRLAQVLNADQSRTWDQLSSGEAVTSTIPVAGNNDEADDETENDVSATTGDAEVADANSVLHQGVVTSRIIRAEEKKHSRRAG